MASLLRIMIKISEYIHFLYRISFADFRSIFFLMFAWGKVAIKNLNLKYQNFFMNYIINHNNLKYSPKRFQKLV